MTVYLLDEQEYFDKHEFDIDAYAILNKRDQKLRHIQLHVAKAALKFISRKPGIICSEVAPDLAIYRSQLMNMFNISTEFVTKHTKPLYTNDAILADIVFANGMLARYLEPREHGLQITPQSDIKSSTISLNNAAHGIAAVHGFDLTDMHRSRLELQLGVAIPFS